MPENWTPTIVVLSLVGVVSLGTLIFRSGDNAMHEVSTEHDIRIEFINRPSMLKIYKPQPESSQTKPIPVDASHFPCTAPECQFGPLSVDASQQPVRITLRDPDGRTALSGNIGIRPDTFAKYEIHFKGDDELHFRLPNVEDVILKKYKFQGKDCVDVSKQAKSCVNEVLTDCFDLGSSHWYGGAELDVQLWPLEKAKLPMAAYLAQVSGFGHVYGPVQERWFFNSAGAGVYIEEDIPLFVSMNDKGDKKLCLQAKYDNRWYVSINNKLPELNYTMCLASNARTIHDLMSDRFIKKPKDIPNPNVLRYPIWSTWALFKTAINQTKVEGFVKDIKKHNFSISNVEIDDQWASSYGDMDFSPVKFPNPKGFVDFIHSQNASVSLWVHPFINVEANAFPTAAKFNFLLRDVSGKSPALTWWWHGNTAGHIDFSNPTAVKFYTAELENLKKKYGVDSFKFDAGDISFLPSMFQGHQQFLNKNHYTRLYAAAACQVDAKQNRLEIRTGARTQDKPALVRILDRSSTWSIANGLKSVITTGLFVGIIGYPFLLPDIIGGDVYSHKPDSELLIRWVQANALMPVMQFSLPPWAANNNTLLEVSQEMVKLHEKYSDLIIDLANQSMSTGYPIMRPLWWIAPTDEAALTVDDQFLVGDDLLVAPVVNQGETIRKLYLPDGRWRDELKGQIYNGGKWMNYTVTLRDLPYFTRVK